MILPNEIGEYKVLNKKSYLPYQDKLFKLFETFSQSNDKLKDNYRIENLEFDHLREITVIVYKDEIVAFASVLGFNAFHTVIANNLNITWTSYRANIDLD